jgi:hypothetical protein
MSSSVRLAVISGPKHIYMRQPKFFEERGEEDKVFCCKRVCMELKKATLLEPKARRHAPKHRL